MLKKTLKPTLMTEYTCGIHLVSEAFPNLSKVGNQQGEYKLQFTYLLKGREPYEIIKRSQKTGLICF